MSSLTLDSIKQLQSAKSQIILALWLAQMFVYLIQIAKQQVLQRQIKFGLKLCKQQCTCVQWVQTLVREHGSNAGLDMRYSTVKGFLNYK